MMGEIFRKEREEKENVKASQENESSRAEDRLKASDT